MPQNVNRIQDAAVANVNEIVPTNWHRFPAPVGSMTPEYVRTVTFVGGAYGDDVDTATAASTDAYTPKTQAEKASMMVPAGSLAEDITRPRGWVEPDDPYSAKPGVGANPTITSLAPNTAVAGSPSPLAVVVTGTNFTPWSTLETGGVVSPYVRYESPTKMTILMDPKRSSAGIVVVKVIDHGVKSAGTNFTYT